MNSSKLLGFALGPFLSAFLGLITVPLMAWIFEPDVIGQIAMFNTFLSGCVLVFTLGLDQAYVREYHEVENKPLLLNSLVSLSFCVVVIFCFIIVLFDEFFVELLFEPQSSSFIIAIGLALSVLFSILYRFLSLVLRMQEKGVKFSLLQVSGKLVTIIFILILLFSNKYFTFITAFAMSVISLIIAGVVAILLTKSECIKALRCKPNSELCKKTISYGSPLIISGIAYWGLISVDRWAIREYAGLEALGVYSVAFSFAAAMTIFQQVFSTVWAPIVYKWHKQETDIKQFVLITDWVVIILSLVFFLVIFCSPLLLYFLPVAYHDVIFLLPACMLFPLFYTLSETTVVGMNIARKTSFSIWITLLALAVNIFLCFVFIPIFGAGGAAAAVGVAFLLYMVLRTEASKYVWQRFETTKLYLSSVILLANGVWPALMLQATPWLISLASLSIIIIFYHRRLRLIKQDINTLKS